jgi:hypothetical protein
MPSEIESLIADVKRINERRAAKLGAEVAAKIEERAKAIANDRDLGTIIWRAAASLFIVVVLVSLAWKLLRWCWT